MSWRRIWSGGLLRAMPDIKAWRSRLGWSQREAARQLGISQKTLSELERATRYDDGRETRIDRRTLLAMERLESAPESRLSATVKSA
jgi:transcriptional regulator with XRE-family HTH domain